LGRRFDLHLLSAVAKRPLDDALELDELYRRGVLEDGDAGHARFVHHQIREAVDAQINDADRTDLHKKVAQAIEANWPEPPKERLAELAHHWDRALEPARARGYCLKAARHAVDQYLHEQAEQFFRRYLELSPSVTKETVQARYELARYVFSLVGRPQDAIAELHVALQQAEEIADRATQARCLQWLGTRLSDMGQMAEAEEHCAQALAIYRDLGDQKSEGGTLANLASIAYRQGSTKAREYCEEAVIIHKMVDDRLSIGRTLNLLGLIYKDQGRFEATCKLFEEALEAARTVNDRAYEGIILSNLALVLHDNGDMEHAVSIPAFISLLIFM